MIVTEDPNSETMVDEIFGPVLTVFIYEDGNFEEVLETCDKGSPYALTGSIFASNEEDVETAANALRSQLETSTLMTSPLGL